MKKALKPSSKAGLCSVFLQIIFLISLAVILFLVFGAKVISFDQAPTFSFMGETSLTWWDVAVPVLGIISLISFITGITAWTKKDRSVSVTVSVIIGLCTVLFVLLHSLFIND